MFDGSVTTPKNVKNNSGIYDSWSKILNLIEKMAKNQSKID